MKIDEQSRRTERYSGDVPVVLADGATWFLPRPKVKYAARPQPDGTPKTARRTSFGRGYDDALDELYASEKDDSEEWYERRMCAQLSLASALLRINYDLSDAEVEDLVQFDYSAEAAPADVEFRKTFMEVAQGISPKGRSPNTSESASSTGGSTPSG